MAYIQNVLARTERLAGPLIKKALKVLILKAYILNVFN